MRTMRGVDADVEVAERTTRTAQMKTTLVDQVGTPAKKVMTTRRTTAVEVVVDVGGVVMVVINLPSVLEMMSRPQQTLKFHQIQTKDPRTHWRPPTGLLGEGDVRELSCRLEEVLAMELRVRTTQRALMSQTMKITQVDQTLIPPAMMMMTMMIVAEGDVVDGGMVEVGVVEVGLVTGRGILAVSQTTTLNPRTTQKNLLWTGPTAVRRVVRRVCWL